MKRFQFVFFLCLIIPAIPYCATNFERINGFEPHFVLPTNSVLKSIKDYGAKGDGVTDDTKAFKDAMAAGQRRLYFPAGTYLVKDQIRVSDGMKRIFFIGEQRSKTIIKLADGSTGFSNPAAPKAFIHTRAPNQQGEQNMACYMYHLTVEIGKNNPGAIGIVFHTNNTGALRDITVRATDPAGGRALRGIAFDDYWFGPGSGRYLEVSGFKSGIYIGSAQNHTTLEHVDIANCDTAVNNLTNAVSIRKLTTTNCGPSVHNKGFIAITDAMLSGTGPAAIKSPGSLLAININSSGYTKAIEASSSSAAGPKVSQFTSRAVASLWTPQSGMDISLGLPVEESPEFQYAQSSADWAVIAADTKVAANVQAAIDAGKTDIFLQGGTISSTIVLRNKAKRIMSFGNLMIEYVTGTQPAFRLENGSSDAVIIELCYGGYASTAEYVCEQASPRTLVIRHGSNSYRTLAGQWQAVYRKQCWQSHRNHKNFSVDSRFKHRRGWQ